MGAAWKGNLNCQESSALSEKQKVEIGKAEIGPQQAAVLGQALELGMVRFDLGLVEILLLLILKRETYGQGRLRAPVRLEAWAAELGKRVDKLSPYWRNLVELKIVDFNAGQGSYQLRPQMQFWSVARGRRAPEKQADGTLKLPLQADRPLDEAYTAVATESVLRGGTEVSGAGPTGQEKTGATTEPPKGARGAEAAVAPNWQGLRQWLDQGGEIPEDLSAEVPAEKAAAGAAKLAGAPADKSAAMEVAKSPPVTRAADLSAGLFTGPLKLSLAQALKAKAKLSSRAADLSAGPDPGDPEASARALEWLRKVDTAGQLGQARVLAQWTELCGRDPRYVLSVLQGRLEDRLHNSSEGPLAKPLGWLATVALDAKKIGRLRK